MKTASNLQLARAYVLGRSLDEILAQPPTNLRFFHVTSRASNVPPARQLFLKDVREVGPRSGISFRLGHTTDRPWRTDGELSAASVAQFMPRVTPKLEYVYIYQRGPHYGSRCRVLTRNGDTVTVQHPTSGDVLRVSVCDTEVAR